ncbi:hypothetical protein KRR23_27705 [Pseudomonas sp. CVAP|uniref:hypothetical protein n=1 Tax=Pseudomonas sp. CVAP\|nr:hypothetical protein [Pseudomonas sp. CVAP\
MNRFFLLAGAMSLSMSALAIDGTPKENDPPGIVKTESGAGANTYTLGDEWSGYTSPITIAADKSTKVGTLLQIENKGEKPTTVKSINTNLNADVELPGKANLQFKFDGTKWVSQGVRKYSDSLPPGALPDGQQNIPPPSKG